MSISEDSRPPDRDTEGGEDADEDPGEELEAMIEQADRPFASDSFGTTAEEQEEGETLDQRLAEERPSRERLDVQVAMRTLMLLMMRSSWWAGLRSSTICSSHPRRRP